MAGLLDSDWVKFLAAPRAYYRDKAAQDSANQFGGLLGTLQEQQGPSLPGQQGLLAAREPDQQFWLKAAQIPGYEGLAGQQLGIQQQGVQAMQRLGAEQNWNASNLTAAQKATLALENLKANRQYDVSLQDLQRKWYGTEASAGASRASAASSVASRDLSAARLDQQLHTNSLLGPNVPLYQQLTPADKVKARTELQGLDVSAQSAMDVADWSEKRSTGAALPGFAGTSEANAMRSEYLLGVKPVMVEWMKSGVLDKGEREEMDTLIGKPDDYVLTASQLNTIKTISNRIASARDQAYDKYGLKGEPLKLGQSAAARTLGAGKPSGELREVGTRPGGNTYSGKVDRSR